MMKIKIIAVPIISIITLSVFAPFVYAEPDFCVYGEDYWFVEGPLYEHIETFNGWNFSVISVKNYELNGVVLSRHNYTKNNASLHPIDIFSPVDVFIGVDDVASDYNNYLFYTYGWEYRVVYSSGDYDEYFGNHVGNNHLIPHNKLAYLGILEIKDGDMIKIKGTLVNLKGKNGNLREAWNTDIQIGNPMCEVILVDNITVNGIEWAGVQEQEIQTNNMPSMGFLDIIIIFITVNATFIVINKKRKEK